MPAGRIASMLAVGSEIVCGLGHGDKLVAISHECDYPPEITDRPRVTRADIDDLASSRDIDWQVRKRSNAKEPLYTVDADRLAALRPELIITQAQCDVCAVRYEDVVGAVRTRPALSGAEIISLNPRSCGNIFTDIQNVATALGDADAGRRWVAALQARVQAVCDLTAVIPKSNRPRVVCIEWIDPLMIAANWMPELIEMAGGRCPLTESGSRSRYGDWRDVVAFDPEIIVVMPCGFALDRAVAESRVLPTVDGWSGIAAVRNRNVYAADGNAYFNRAGPRIVDSIELLAGLICPDRFGSFRDAYRAAWSRLEIK